MSETESITVAEVSDGPCASGTPGHEVELPVVELLTGRGFVTGKSGSGKSNTASVLAEKLLDNGFGLLIVDIDGEYYGLKEEYEILHAGADDECDIQVTVEHAGKIASLALEQNVPIILDVSSCLDEEEAQELLTEVAKRLFAKAKKLKQPFLMLVEECHEYIPQKGSVGECGKMLIKISKRGRKHGLGIVGISQRPADVKKDFITQCDWLVWHRLTWNNDTKVVSRILGSDYAEAVEDLDDGEAFMMTDWAERVGRVQFQRKKTFDAGATPGLDDFERPDLKSVSDDLVSELEEISEEKAETESRIAELREELDEKNSRIAELEAELQDARDMQRMADQFTQALVDHVKGANPGRTEKERMREQRQAATGDQSSFDDEWADAAPTEGDEAPREDDDYDATAMTWVGDGDLDGGPTVATDAGNASDEAGEAASPESFEDLAAEDAAASEPAEDSATSEPAEPEGTSEPVETRGASDEAVDDAVEQAQVSGAPAHDADEMLGMAEAFDDGSTGESTPRSATDGGSSTTPDGLDRGSNVPATVTRGFDGVEENPLSDRATEAFAAGTSTAIDPETVADAAEFARELADDLADLEPKTRQMLRYYRDHGSGSPMDALFAAGGSEDRTEAYARNRRLRVLGLVEHVGRGRYDYRVPALLRDRTDREQVRPFVEQVESALESATDEPGSSAEWPSEAGGAD